MEKRREGHICHGMYNRLASSIRGKARQNGTQIRWEHYAKDGLLRDAPFVLHSVHSYD